MRDVVYEYGLRQPTAGDDIVSEQIHLAHCYYNALIDAERERRAAIVSAQESVGDISVESSAYGEAKEFVEELLKRKRLSRGHGSGVVAPSRGEIAEAKASEKAALSALRAAKKTAKEDLAPLYQRADGEYRLAHKAIRAAYSKAGLYWGTYLQVEQSIDQARKAPSNPKKQWVECPSYRRWTGGGCVAVQVQSTKPLDEETVFGEDTRLRIDPLHEDAFNAKLSRGKRRLLQYTTVHLRVGSDGRTPIWASWPLYMHRPLPEGAVIKWAKVIREPLHQRFPWRWKLQLTIGVPEAEPRPGMTMVAVNIGWRQMVGGELRVATWADSNGDVGELRLGRSFRDRIEKAEGIRSYRDQEMDALRELLVEAGIDCSRWKSPERFHRLLREMRSSAPDSVDSPGSIAELLEDWAYRDKHLHWYERGCRRGALLYRREQYRLLALELCKRYPVLVVENYDLRPIVTDENRVKEPSAQRVEGAPYQLRQCLKSTASRLGCTVIDGDSKMATQRCHVCGHEEPWDAAPRVEHTCPACGETWDQDVNNAINMLASARDAIKDKGALAVGKPKRSARFSKRHKKQAA